MIRPDLDLIHKTPRSSIYTRTDYIVNSDMSIPLAFGERFVAEAESEALRRTGLPRMNRAPADSPLVLHGAPNHIAGK